MPRRGHVYDLRRRKYLGLTDHLDTTVGPVEVYVILPYRVAPLTLTASAASVERGAEVTVTMKSASADGLRARHVLHCEAISPGGQPAPSPGNVVSENGQVTWTWHTAYNAEAGAWRVRATDVISGAQGEVAVRLK